MPSEGKGAVFGDIVPIRPDTPPLPSHFGTSIIGTFELGFGPPPTFRDSVLKFGFF